MFFPTESNSLPAAQNHTRTIKKGAAKAPLTKHADYIKPFSW